MPLVELFIPGNVPSSKNSRQHVTAYSSNGKKYFKSIPSKLVRNYKAETENYWLLHKHEFRHYTQYLDLPLKVEFEFVRSSKRKFDFINAAQIIQDMMVKYDWIDDDNMNELIPLFTPHSVDKENAGVYIRIHD